jgi:hypothetical protein
MSIIKLIKDDFFSFVIRTIAKIKIKRYGEMLDFQIDSENHKILIKVSLKGEPEPLIITVNKYEIVKELDQEYLEIKSVTTSKEWMNLLIEDFLKDQRFPLPEKGSGVIKMVID